MVRLIGATLLATVVAGPHGGTLLSADALHQRPAGGHVGRVVHAEVDSRKTDEKNDYCRKHEDDTPVRGFF